MVFIIANLFFLRKSFTTLINTSYSMKNGAEAPETNNRDSGVLSDPLSFIHSGYFIWGEAYLYSRGNNGLYWSLRSANTIVSNGLDFSSVGMYSQSGSARGYGFAVRLLRPLLQ